MYGCIHGKNPADNEQAKEILLIALIVSNAKFSIMIGSMHLFVT